MKRLRLILVVATALGASACTTLNYFWMRNFPPSHTPPEPTGAWIRRDVPFEQTADGELLMDIYYPGPPPKPAATPSSSTSSPAPG